MEFKTLSYKNLRNTRLGMVFKCVMMVIMLSVVSLSASGQRMTVDGTEKIASEGQPDPKIEKFEVNGVVFEMVYVPG
ncbi:MAG: hypothetical protein ACI4SO_01055, partial [Muribaculaceae bacterium]